MKKRKYIVKHFIDRLYGKVENGKLTLITVYDNKPFEDQVTLFSSESEAGAAIGTYHNKGSEMTSNDVLIILTTYI